MLLKNNFRSAKTAKITLIGIDLSAILALIHNFIFPHRFYESYQKKFVIQI